ncbi:diguanylate cyclase [Candidatus Sumerlaeota bacterium]|nr:diguanylate cyclase [Candidatus Sumerlaeota bacterium]
MNDKELTVLAVDDNPDDLHLYQRYLEEAEGLEANLICADSAESALKVMKENEIDVVLLDYQLGAEDGLSLLKQLMESEKGRSPAVIMVTGRGDEKIAVQALKSGAVDYIPKSDITADSLRLAIGRALESLDERKEAEQEKQQLEQLARFDALTNIPNRRSFMEDLLQEIDRASRYQRPLSLVMADLDNFKAINDKYGHITGDEVLSRFAMILKHTLRDIDVAGRLGGEEFCVFLPETDLDGAAIIAERVRDRAAEEVYTGQEGEKFNVTCSIGIAALSRSDSDTKSISDEELRSLLYQEADRALYQAKAEGRNCVRAGIHVNANPQD